MSVSSYPFHSLLFKLPNKGMSFPFPPLKLQNKRIEEYSKMILFISFNSLLPNEALRMNAKCKAHAKQFFYFLVKSYR